MFYTTNNTARWEVFVYDDSGALVNADSTPTAKLVVNGLDDIAAVTVTNPSTGRYKVSCSLGGRTVGDVCYFVVTATVGGVTQSIAQPEPFLVASPNLDALLRAGGTLTITEGIVVTENPNTYRGIDIQASGSALYVKGIAVGNAIEAVTHGSGSAIKARATGVGYGIEVESNTNAAISAYSTGGGDGIYVQADLGGSAIRAVATGDGFGIDVQSNADAAISAYSGGGGPGIYVSGSPAIDGSAGGIVGVPVSPKDESEVL